MSGKKVIGKKKIVIFSVVTLVVIAGTVAFTHKKVLLESTQLNSNNYDEQSTIDNWDLTKVDMVYDETGIAVPVPKGYTASSVESEKYVNGIDETYAGTETELQFTSSGDYIWTQNEDDGVWVSGNSGVKSSTSALTSNEFVVGEDGGMLKINWSVSCDTNSYLYAIITNVETGTEVQRSYNLAGTDLGTSYESLKYVNFQKELSAGKYAISIEYYRSYSSNGLDSGYVKSASIVSYDDVGSAEVTVHKYGGFVIYEGTEAVTDSNVDTAQKTRNQWVWVPVDGNKVYRIYMENPITGVQTGLLYNFSSTRRTLYTERSEPSILTFFDRYSYFPQNGFQGATREKLYQELQVEFKETIKSIKKYGGFYIGRYETGNLSSKVAVVQKMNADISLQSWYTMYNAIQYLSKGTNVKASMIWGCLWDETVQWFVDSGNFEQAEIASSRSTLGNYSDLTFTYTAEDGTIQTKVGNTRIPTGSAEYTKNLNIYDMAGNVEERTLESNGYNRRVTRGGSYYSRSNSTSVCTRSELNASYTYNEVRMPCIPLYKVV
jgi:hypothetical protein